MKRKIKKYVLFALCILALAILIRIVIGEPCKVPSGSMEPTIRTGEWLWIDKLTYGGRLPERWADIPLLNVFTQVKAWREADAKRDWGYHRLPGFAKPKVGDVVVFNSPENEELLLTKRITDIRVENGAVSYFMQGDNRDNSHDSRAFGWVAERLIVGKIHKGKSNANLLSDIETTMQTDIDKANRMLDNIRPERLSKKEQADYCRMKASCSARLFMQWNKADSLNSIALNYYRQTNDTANLKKSLYLSGQINLNRNEPDRAIECFSELEKMAFQEKQRPYQAHLNYLLSRCYIEKKDDNAAIQYSKNAIACIDEQDSARLAYYCKETGALYAQTNAVDSAWAYYRKAMDLSMQQKEMEHFTSLMFNDMAQWLLSNNEYKEALKYAEKSMQYRASRKDASLFNLTKARIFIALNETDSARLYLNRTIESSENNYLTIMAYRHLSDLYKAEGDYEQAFRKLLNYDGFMKDSQSNINMNLLSQQYKEVQLENENNSLKLAKRNRELELLSVVFLATVAGVVFWYFYSSAKKKEKMRIQQQREQNLKNQATIAEQENRLLKQEKELSQLNEKAAVLRESLFRKLTVSEKIPSLDVSGHHENGNSHKKIALEESDWKELVETIDAVFNGFSSRLKKAYPQLSIDDVRFCCLLKINVSLQDLADIYCISKAGITKRKMRMKKEKFDIIDNQLDLNEFLIRY